MYVTQQSVFNSELGKLSFKSISIQLNSNLHILLFVFPFN